MRHYVVAPHRHQVDVLLGSMLKHCGDFTLHVLCWDWYESRRWERFEMHGRVGAIEFTSRADFLARHPGLLPLPGPPRNANETVCSVRWTFARDVMADTGQPVTCLDGDLFAFSDPEPVFEEIGGAGLALLPHNFAHAAQGLHGCTWETSRIHGLFNAGLVYAADPRPIERLAELAREWCYIGFKSMPDGRLVYGDQVYLEMLHEEFGGHVIQHVGAAPGPWSIHTQTLARAHDGALFFGGRPLVFYHFSSYRHDRAQLADAHYEVERADGAVAWIYNPYIIANSENAAALRSEAAR